MMLRDLLRAFVDVLGSQKKKVFNCMSAFAWMHVSQDVCG